MTPAERGAAKRRKLMVLIGQHLQYWRQNASMTQATLARKSGISERTVRRIETGKRLPTILSVYRMGKALQLDPAEILPWDNPL